jgi:VanZ family protein
LFGVFGCLSVARFGLWRGILVCATVGVLDEGLQWYLPDRVGDLRDVAWNLLAGGGGAVLATGLQLGRK